MDARTVRLTCANLGHAWNGSPQPFLGDSEPWFEEKDRNGGKVWVQRLTCQRDGCERTRTDKVQPRTFQLLNRTYGGKIERLGRLTREDLRKELIRRQNKK